MTGADDETGLRRRLAAAWAGGDMASLSRDFMLLGFDAAASRLSGQLRIDRSDAEDCVAQALEALLRRSGTQEIAEPLAYLRRSAWNFGVTLLRGRGRESALEVEAMDGEPPGGRDADGAEALPGVNSAWAVVAVEEALGEVDADEDWAVPVVQAAMERLTPGQRDVVAHLSKLGFDTNRGDFDSDSSVDGAILGLSGPAFRKAKERAYAALASEIPRIVRELGIRPPSRFATVFEESPGAFMPEG